MNGFQDWQEQVRRKKRNDLHKEKMIAAISHDSEGFSKSQEMERVQTDKET